MKRYTTLYLAYTPFIHPLVHVFLLYRLLIRFVPTLEPTQVFDLLRYAMSSVVFPLHCL